jgi:hypothetical protein
MNAPPIPVARAPDPTGFMDEEKSASSPYESFGTAAEKRHANSSKEVKRCDTGRGKNTFMLMAQHF